MVIPVRKQSEDLQQFCLPFPILFIPLHSFLLQFIIINRYSTDSLTPPSSQLCLIPDYSSISVSFLSNSSQIVAGIHSPEFNLIEKHRFFIRSMSFIPSLFSPPILQQNSQSNQQKQQKRGRGRIKAKRGGSKNTKCY